MGGCTASSSYKAEKRSWEFASYYRLPYILFFAAQGAFDLCNVLHAYKHTIDKETKDLSRNFRKWFNFPLNFLQKLTTLQKGLLRLYKLGGSQHDMIFVFVRTYYSLRCNRSVPTASLL